MNKEHIIIVGFGWVGQANAIALSRMGHAVSFYDPAEPPHHHQRFEPDYASITRIINPRDVDSPSTCFVVCVGDRVSEDGVQDIARIKEALNALEKTQGTVILRSTVLPQHLKDLTFDFYVPEFLHEKQAVEECIDPYFFVVGKRNERLEPSFFSRWRKSAYKVFEGTPEEASQLKYLSNIWNATRIAFVNEFGNAIGTPSNKEELASIERVVNFMFDGRPYMRYGRAFKGHCLPKDTRAFIRASNDAGVRVLLFEGVYASNAIQEKLEQKHPLMPEWYSFWPDKHVSAAMAIKSVLYTVTKRLGIIKKPTWNR